MSDRSPPSAREALIAEALGEIAALLDRVDGVVQALELATASATDACARIDARAAAFEASTAALVEASKQHLVRHVAMKTEELGRAAGEAQIQAVGDALGDLFRNELEPLAERLAADCARRTAGSRGWHRHWAYAAIAIGTSAITAFAATYLLSR